MVPMTQEKTRVPSSTNAASSFSILVLSLSLLFLIPFSSGCKDGGKEFRRVLRSAARTPSKTPSKSTKQENSEKGSTKQVANKDAITSCPKESRLVGSAYPKGISQWCAASSKDGKEVRHGGYRRWHKNGNLKSKEFYYLGKHDGKVERFYKSGTPRELITFDKGVKSGPFEQWNKDGTQKLKGFYLDGAKHGHFAWWSRGGQLKEQGEYVNDLKSGEWVSFHRNGNIKTRARWHEGRLHGPSDSYDRDGKLVEREVYAMNVPDGRWISFHRNGHKKQEGSFSQGQKHGPWVLYGRDGRLVKTTIFDEGTVVGQKGGSRKSRRSRKRRKSSFGKGDILGAPPPLALRQNPSNQVVPAPEPQVEKEARNFRKGFGEVEEKDTGWEPL